MTIFCGKFRVARSHGRSGRPAQIEAGGESLKHQFLSALSVLGAVLALSGCGGDGGPATATVTSAVSRTDAPAPGSGAKGSVSGARAAGRRACRGADPLEIARRYESSAQAAGASKQFVALAAHPTPAMRRSAGYPRLAAAIYAATRPPSQRAQAAAGCAEELASP